MILDLIMKLFKKHNLFKTFILLHILLNVTYFTYYKFGITYFNPITTISETIR